MSKIAPKSHTQRRIPEGTPLKKEGFKRLVAGCLSILKELEQRGPLNRKELINLAKIPEGTLDRYLHVLREFGCIQKAGKKYSLYSDVLIYGGKTDQILALDHSRNVAEGFLSRLPEIQREPEYKGLEAKPKYWKLARSHARTAPEYRQIHESLENAEKALKRSANLDLQLKIAIREKIWNSKLGLKDETVIEIMSNKIVEDIREISVNRKPRFLECLKVEGNEVRSNSFTICDESRFKQVKRFILLEEGSKENREICKAILNRQNESQENGLCFKKSAEKLIQQVLNGTPMKGRCTKCPKVVTETEAQAQARGSR